MDLTSFEAKTKDLLQLILHEAHDTGDELKGGILLSFKGSESQ